ncbi:MAG: DUF983 domain-containing protein [Hyphomonadaceae bacterium]
MRQLDRAQFRRHSASMTHQPDLPRRDMWLAIRRGLRLRCPACGKGKLLAGYLRPAERCSECGEATGEIRADDGPAWATILLVGHLVSPAFFVFATADADAGLRIFLLVGAAVVGATLLLLPRMKGLFMALIWASRAGETEPG